MLPSSIWNECTLYAVAALIPAGPSRASTLTSTHPAKQVPHVVRALLDTQIAAVACGGAHTAAVADDGSLYTFGLNDRSQLGHSMEEQEVPVPQVGRPQGRRWWAVGLWRLRNVGDASALAEADRGLSQISSKADIR